METQNKAEIGVIEPQKKKIHVKYFVALMVFVVVLGVPVFWLASKPSYACDGSDDNDLYREASLLIADETKLDELGELVEKMKNKKGYDSDVNCIYFSTRYSMMISNTAESSRLFERYETLYADNNHTLSKSVTNKQSIQQLREHLEFLKVKSEKLDSSNGFFGHPSTTDQQEEEE